jgi:opacity protein-like surface antigen
MCFKLLRVMLFGVIVFSARSALASNWYMGVLAGQSRADLRELEDGFQYDRVTPFFFQSLQMSSRHSGVSQKLFVGTEMTQYFGIETSFAHFSKQRLYGDGIANFSNSSGSTRKETVLGDRRVAALALDAVAKLPLTETLSLTLAAGVAHTWVSLVGETKGGPAYYYPEVIIVNIAETKRSIAPHAAIGAMWEFAPAWALRGSYEYLGKVGSAFSGGQGGHTGASALTTAWVGVSRKF